MNCWSVGIFLVFFLASLCLWNCLREDDVKNEEDWYGCLDQLGKPTDFFTLYKLPQDRKSQYSIIQKGTAYMFLTPDSSTRLQSGGVSSVLSYSDSSSSWVLSNLSINELNSMPGRTLRYLYKNKSFKSTAAYFMYNDEFPNGTVSLAHGHSKGVLVMSDLGGYWLIHSVPKYPPPPEDSYSYPSSAHRYGQSALCISLPPITQQLVETIALQLIQNDVFVYSWNVPSNMKSQYPLLEEIIHKKQVKDPPTYRVAKFPSAHNKVFTSFAKNKKFGADLYSELIAPTLKTNLFVESWRNGPEPLPSSCNSSYTVENIQSIKAASASLSFTTHHDHSKWAVSQYSDMPYVCVGDINRMETQFVRGGGSVCIWSLSIWNRFKSLIDERETCPRYISLI